MTCYFILWKDESFMDILVDEWMKLPLHAGWETKVLKKAKVYLVGLKNHQCMDTVFDKMHWQRKLI